MKNNAYFIFKNNYGICIFIEQDDDNNNNDYIYSFTLFIISENYLFEIISLNKL